MTLQLPSAPKRNAGAPAGDEREKRAKVTDNAPPDVFLSASPTFVSRNDCLFSTSPAAAQAVVSPYATTYHHNTSGTHPTTRHQLSQRCGLRLGEVPFEDVKLSLPHDMPAQEQQAIKRKWQRELQRQEANPPALPPSRIPPLPPKETLEEYHEVPEGATEEEKQRIRDRNNVIAEQSQKIDRERNNQAAKKSRITRLEKLSNTREILNSKSAECDWMRLKLIQLGGDVAEWDNLEARFKNRIIAKVQERVSACDQQLAEEKKREEQQKRAQRTRARIQAREASSLPSLTSGPEIMPTPMVQEPSSQLSEMNLDPQPFDGLEYPPQS
jgi:hypothetical protein